MLDLKAIFGDEDTTVSPLPYDGALSRQGQDSGGDAERAACPFCGASKLVDGTRGLWCDDCSQLAWLDTATGIVRADYADTEAAGSPKTGASGDPSKTPSQIARTTADSRYLFRT